jgi:hypothetical protein
MPQGLRRALGATRPDAGDLQPRGEHDAKAVPGGNAALLVVVLVVGRVVVPAAPTRLDDDAPPLEREVEVVRPTIRLQRKLPGETVESVGDQQPAGLDLELRSGRVLRIELPQQLAHSVHAGVTAPPEPVHVGAKRGDERELPAARVFARDLQGFLVEERGQAQEHRLDARDANAQASGNSRSTTPARASAVSWFRDTPRFNASRPRNTLSAGAPSADKAPTADCLTISSRLRVLKGRSSARREPTGKPPGKWREAGAISRRPRWGRNRRRRAGAPSARSRSP